MIVKKLLKIGVIAIVVVVAACYIVGAYTYDGKYKATVTMDLELGDTIGAVEVFNIQVASEPMEPLSIFDALKVSPEVRGNYSVFVTLNQSGVEKTSTTGVIMSDPKVTYTASLEILEVQPGDATVRVFVVWNLVNSVVYDYTKAVTIGP